MTNIKQHSIHTLFANKDVKETRHILRSLCGPMRFEITLILSKYPEGLTVSEIAELLHSSLSRISHQLRILKKDNLVGSTREGRNVTYRIAHEHVRKHFKSLI